MGTKYKYIPLTQPTLITKQVWPEGTIPLVHTRTMTFNHENYIRDCIEGILMQKTTFPVQVLIHDDASTDNTRAIVQEYEQKYPTIIKVFYQKENSYTKPDKLDRRSEFWSWRIGKYEALCEGDDYWTDPLKLQKQVVFLEENCDFGVVFTDYDILNMGLGSNIKAYNHTTKKKIPVGFVFEKLLYMNPYVTCTSMIRKEALASYSDYNFFKDGTLQGRDYSMWLHIAANYKVGYIPLNSAVYRVLENSASHSSKIETEIKFHIENQELAKAFAIHHGVKINESKFSLNLKNTIIKSIIIKGKYSLLWEYKSKPFVIIKQLLIELVLKPYIFFFKRILST